MSNTKSKNLTLKGGYFIIGETLPEALFIAEEFAEEANMIGDTVQEFCLKEIQKPFFQIGKELMVTDEEDKAKVLAILLHKG